MNAVERVKLICKERKIPISRLETDCGFANGYIGQLKKGTFPDDRLRKISEYLDLSTEFIMTGNEPSFSSESAHLVSKIRNDTELSNALLKYFELSDVKKKHVVELINFLSEGINNG